MGGIPQVTHSIDCRDSEGRSVEDGLVREELVAGDVSGAIVMCCARSAEHFTALPHFSLTTYATDIYLGADMIAPFR